MAAGARAQTNTGDLSGLVRDVQGSPLANAHIIAAEPLIGVRIEKITDSGGRYLLSSLPVGRYSISVELNGFHAATREVVVQLGASLTIDFTLQVGAIAEDVHVFANVPVLQATNAEISDVIANREVVQLPLNGRNFISLAQLSDGVVIPPGGTRGDALQQAGPLPNIGGQRSGHNIYMLDGFKVTDELFNNLVINPSVDSIQEFKIQKSQYPAEFGGKASALINVATRAGANLFSATAFEFLRDDALDARNYFDRSDTPRLPMRQHQFGGAAGGPIVKNRTFFFAALERQQTHRSSTRTFTVPTAAVRSGDFSGLAAIRDPVAAGGCVPFTGNQIPSNRIDPVARALLDSVPLPNVGGTVQNLVSNEQQTREANQVSVRVDQQVGVADRVFGRVSGFDADELQPFGTSALQEALLPGFGRQLGTHSWNAGASHTHVVGNAAFNELRVGWLNVTGGQTSVNQGVDIASRAGIRGVSLDPRDAGYPQISTRGLYTTFGDPTTFVSRRNRHLEIYDNLTINRGAHRLKMGGYLFHLRFNPEQPDNARGAFTYSGQFTGNAFADFLLGYPASAVSGIGRGDEDGRTNWVHVFAQDDWRMRGNLTVNVGLRYEYNQHMRAVDNRLSSVDLSVPGGRFVVASDENGGLAPDAQTLLPLIPVPWVTSEEAGWERGLLRPSRGPAGAPHRLRAVAR
ncbi:MAG: TonB-dependent receptor [Vicinamibacterales bacterium]